MASRRPIRYSYALRVPGWSRWHYGGVEIKLKGLSWPRKPLAFAAANARTSSSGVAHVNSTFNNTMITITDAQGNTIAWSSAGAMGFKGSRKSTPYAAQMAAEDAAKKAQEHGMRTLEVEVSRSRFGP